MRAGVGRDGDAEGKKEGESKYRLGGRGGRRKNGDIKYRLEKKKEEGE